MDWYAKKDTAEQNSLMHEVLDADLQLLADVLTHDYNLLGSKDVNNTRLAYDHMNYKNQIIRPSTVN